VNVHRGCCCAHLWRRGSRGWYCRHHRSRIVSRSPMATRRDGFARRVFLPRPERPHVVGMGRGRWLRDDQATRPRDHRPRTRGPAAPHLCFRPGHRNRARSAAQAVQRPPASHTNDRTARGTALDPLLCHRASLPGLADACPRARSKEKDCRREHAALQTPCIRLPLLTEVLPRNGVGGCLTLRSAAQGAFARTRAGQPPLSPISAATYRVGGCCSAIWS
jgi:hypothetical protein